MEFYYIMHYVIYRYYRRHLETSESSIIYAFGIISGLSLVFINGIDYFMHLFFNIPRFLNKVSILVCVILCMIFKYIVLFRNERYREIFNEYDRLRDEPEMIAKCKQAKIFNYSLLVINIVTLFIIDYINNHK
ncbi:hypothetical protein SAMN05444375_1202 [Segatella baroniae B14]|nr:hypothetical protein SAMN05444375_1202 [Segatella baroniae B14]